MNGKNRAKLRAIWVDIHLWLGLTLGIIGIAIGLTGSVLVFDHEIDEIANPQRYAITGSEAALPHADYLERAGAALGGRATPAMLRLPGPEGGPVAVFARARAGFARVYIDPPTGRVLDIAAGGGFLGWAHQFHENLTLRQYAGREIVGAVGIAMLISSLSGLYLWWPLRRWQGAFGFRRGFTLTRNLHYTCGFYGAVLLALLSFTGIFLAYPDAARAMTAWFAPVSPSLRGVAAEEGEGRPIRVPEAVGIATGLYPAASVAGIGLPAGAQGVYRISLRSPGDESERGDILVLIDPRTKAVLRQSDAARRTAGDAFLAAQRTIHAGEAFGWIGRVLFTVAGLLPGLLAVTGTFMWLRKRRQQRRATGGARAPALQR